MHMGDCTITERHLRALYELEACADQRIDNDVCALSKLTKCAELAREAIAALTGSAANPLYPPKPKPKPQRNAHVAEPFRRIVNEFSAGVLP
jgi:hypothetical protein